MAEKIHPAASPPESLASDTFPRKLAPPPGMYVIQVPKDQIYRIPPPENDHRFQYLSRRKPRRSLCRCCFCSFLAGIFIIAVVVGISAAVLYLLYRPETPRYSVERVSISGFNVTSSSSSPISPRFNVTVRSSNGNGKIGIYYGKGSSAEASYKGLSLCNGALPALYQPASNVTVFKTALTGKKIRLTSSMRKEMRDMQTKKTVPFRLRIKVPVSIRVGSVRSWTVSVRVDCDLTVDKLTAASRVVSTKCSHHVDRWW